MQSFCPHILPAAKCPAAVRTKPPQRYSSPHLSMRVKKLQRAICFETSTDTTRRERQQPIVYLSKVMIPTVKIIVEKTEKF